MKNNELNTARYIFIKWEDTPVKKAYEDHFEIFESEIRKTSECPEIFKWIPTIWFESNSNMESEEGRILEATYYPDKVTPEEIEKFFEDYKIRVKRAKPFFVDRNESKEELVKFIEKVKKIAANPKLSLSILPEQFAICKLDANAQIPDWALNAVTLSSITRTADELSIVYLEKIVPEGIKCEKGWRALKIEGPLNFELTGILASLANPLAEAKISIFAISTFDTDYILVKNDRLEETIKILSKFCNI